jgi:hypothetical protein
MTTFTSDELEAALALLGTRGTLLAGAAIQGAGRSTIALLEHVDLSAGAGTYLWTETRKGGRFLTAGAILDRHQDGHLLRLAEVASRTRPDLVHLFVDLTDAPDVSANLTSDRLAPAGYTAQARRTSYRYVLPLGHDYDAFLADLGKHTRRNIRLYQRRGVEAGLTFSFIEGAPDPASRQERETLGHNTHPKPKRSGRLAELDAFLTARRRPFHGLVRTHHGNLIGLATGFIAADRAYLVYQANHADHTTANLGLMQRALIVRELIARGVSAFVFPNGINDILRNACRRDTAIEVLLARTELLARWRIRRWARREPRHTAARFMAGAQPA